MPGSPAAGGSPIVIRPPIPMTFVFYAWGARRELPVGKSKNYTAFKDRMLQRPAVRRALDDEQIKV